MDVVPGNHEPLARHPDRHHDLPVAAAKVGTRFEVDSARIPAEVVSRPFYEGDARKAK